MSTNPFEVSDIPEPRFLQYVTRNTSNDFFDALPKYPLPWLLQSYQHRTREFYRQVDKYGDLLEIAMVPEDQYESGSDEDRDRWRHAGRQQVLWMEVSVLNGEIARRIQAGKREAVHAMTAMVNTMLADLSDDGVVHSEDSEAEPEA